MGAQNCEHKEDYSYSLLERRWYAIVVNLKVNSSILPEARGERLCNR
jgi:hypothetical protein